MRIACSVTETVRDRDAEFRMEDRKREVMQRKGTVRTECSVGSVDFNTVADTQ